MKSAVIVFPGSNCDRDMAVAMEKFSGRKAIMVWHRETELPDGLDVIAIPGGFSYGDYLRSGAMAARAAIIPAVVAAAQRGVRVLGVCNGFQILTETGLLPGALMRNAGIRFVCRDAALAVANNQTPFSRRYSVGQSLSIPVAHHDGNYFADADTLRELQDHGQVVFTYRDNFNGSAQSIAGLSNRAGNVLGMMPHPERAIDAVHGGTDGAALFEALLNG